MKIRNDLLERKKIEITSIVSKVCMNQSGDDTYSVEIMEDLLDSGGLFITPPEEPSYVMNMLNMDSLNDFHKGESVKPGNIKLNIRRLIGALPELISEGAEVVSGIPLLKICAILSIWKMLINITTVEITKGQAIAIVALWENCDNNQRIPLEKGFDCINSLCRRIQSPENTWEQYIKLIGELEKLNSVELDIDGIWLREWVSGEYTK